MSGEIEIIDDFLPEEDFLRIRDVLMAEDFPWFTSTVVDPGNSTDELRNVQMVHEIYLNMKPVSRACDVFESVINKLDVVALLRIKANLVLGTEKIVEHGYHTDVREYVNGMRTGVLYMNTCNGYTAFENDTQVQSVANRFVSFPAYMRHTGTTTTDEKVRVVVNFNYIHADNWRIL